MRKAKITESEKLEIIQEFHTDTPASHVAAKYGRDYTTVAGLWKAVYSEDALKQRACRMKGLAKMGDKNPMKGKHGVLHHNAKMYTVSTQGYVETWAPAWYTGPTDGGRALLHIVVYCESAGLLQLPAGQVVHHIDCDRTNNDVSNLVMLSAADHFKIHQFIRKVQRLSERSTH